jgi:hypothetical protein
VGKPFEITYSPANWDAPPGGVAAAWSVPYGGLNVQTPENLIGPSYTPQASNFLFRNGELRSRNNFGNYLPGPDGQNPILGVGSFLSKNQVWHTFCFTINGLYQLMVNAQAVIQQGGNPWQRLGGPLLSSGNPVDWRTFQSILYYTNGSGHLSAWDGSNPAPLTDVAATGATFPLPNNYTGTAFSSLFLGELDSHMIMAYVTETSYTSGAITGVTNFPQRIRWSNIGFNPSGAGAFGSNLGTVAGTFDPTISVNAGLNDFLDVTDIITGMMFLGRMGYIFRQNGITEMDPTGNGTAPFDFNHLWASEHGIGNVYPSSIAQYGSYGMFVASDNIYQVSPGNVQAVGGGARDAIMLDLSNAAAPPTAVIIPSYAVYRVYLSYQLFIPQNNGNTNMWIYSFEDNNWAPCTLSGVTIGRPAGCWIGDAVISNQSIVTTR